MPQFGRQVQSKRGIMTYLPSGFVVDATWRLAPWHLGFPLFRYNTARPVFSGCCVFGDAKMSMNTAGLILLFGGGIVLFIGVWLVTYGVIS